MPFTMTCPDHPSEFIDGNEEAIVAHARTFHPDVPMPVAAARIERRFESQLAAQGGTPLFVMGCRVCGVRVESRDPNRRPYCDEHDAH